MKYRIGIDVGGTFTDLFLWSEDGSVETFKVLSTPEDPSEGVFDGLAAIAEQKGLGVSELTSRIGAIVHGTTVTTNAVLTRGGAATGLLTTRGVRDALEMRRGIREEQYDNRLQNVVPLVPRWLRLTAAGRLDWKGEELEALSTEDVRVAAGRFLEAGCDAVAICFMNAFANDSQERQAAEILRAELPDCFVSVSSELLPTIRFYNRVSTTVLNGYVGPILHSYLGSLTAKLAAIGFGGVLLIMQSNGGVAVPQVTLARPATTLLS
ncbi:MAG: hydantoinase/oxoprolinase family protein, partial [Planctomycetota bacterium]